METSEHAPPSGFRPASRQRTPSAYRICDGITESALYFMIVFAPWSFGTTERWSIWTMNIAGYALGELLLVKRWVGWRAGYRPARWGDPDTSPQPPDARNPRPEMPGARSQRTEAARLLAGALAALTVAILAFCLVSAVNARASVVTRQMA